MRPLESSKKGSCSNQVPVKSESASENGYLLRTKLLFDWNLIPMKPVSA